MARMKALETNGSLRADSAMTRVRMLPRAGRMYACNRPVHFIKRKFARSGGKSSELFSAELKHEAKNPCMQDCLTAAICDNYRSHERWNTSHSLGDARDKGSFRGGCASPRIIRFGASEAPGRSHGTERQCRGSGDTRGRRPGLSGLTLDGPNPPRRPVAIARTCNCAGDGGGNLRVGPDPLPSQVSSAATEG